jgi:hypothetical protein
MNGYVNPRGSVLIGGPPSSQANVRHPQEGVVAERISHCTHALIVQTAWRFYEKESIRKWDRVPWLNFCVGRARQRKRKLKCE